MSSLCTSNLTSGFVDLATFDDVEKYLYGGDQATTYFVRETRKSNWFTQVPVALSKCSGSPAFGADWSANISRAGDYLLHTWLRVKFPAVTQTAQLPVFGGAPEAGTNIRWTKNLMHNLVRECNITFNDLVAARFDSYHLDFWAAFTVPAGKRNGYNNMIGNISSLTYPQASLPAATLNLPLPFFYSRDSGFALPTAALPYNEMRINFCFRDWKELLVVDSYSAGSVLTSRAAVDGDVTTTPVLGQTNVWANYAIVSNNERSRMGCAPRDILIEQVQMAPHHTFAPLTNPTPTFDVRFSHAIKVLFFAVRNKTVAPAWSNYTTAQPVVTAAVTAAPVGSVVYAGLDPIINTSIIYENTSRMSSMGSDYYSLVQPYYHAPVIPTETGHHMYSYSLDFMCPDPEGSTNYGKLANVSVVPEASAAAITAAADQTFEFIITSVNNNIVRVSGGALGFPVL